MTTATLAVFDERRMTRFLSQRFGDGLIYLTGPADRGLYRLAINLGFVSEQGYVTSPGKHFWEARKLQ